MFSSGIHSILGNLMFVNAVLGWFTAQVLKTIINAIRYRKLDWSRLIGDGGMPSGHSATVTALAVTSGFEYGLGSPVFAVTAILAIVVMHDAMGVRFEAGKHAKALNELLRLQRPDNLIDEFDEFLGHTPSQVICGAILGLLIACIHH